MSASSMSDGGEGLAAVSTASLQRIREALRQGRLHTPPLRADLVTFGVREQIDALVAALAGHSQSACLTIIDVVLAERRRHVSPGPELVWTGPEGGQASARDTAVVLRALFDGARDRVVLAGYSFKNAVDVLGPLHQGMSSRGVTARFFVDVPQPPGAVDATTYGQRMLSEFMRDNWPFGPPYPELYCDRRSLQVGPPWSSLHAKCVSVDGRHAFVSSANFTSRGQERNIEAGVLLHDANFASQLERQWMSLVGEGLVLQWDAKA